MPSFEEDLTAINDSDVIAEAKRRVGQVGLREAGAPADEYGPEIGTISKR